MLFMLAALDLQAQQTARDADLGIPAEAFERFDDDYRRTIEAAVPRFDGDGLAERLRTLHARHPQEWSGQHGDQCRSAGQAAKRTYR